MGFFDKLFAAGGKEKKKPSTRLEDKKKDTFKNQKEKLQNQLYAFKDIYDADPSPVRKKLLLNRIKKSILTDEAMNLSHLTTEEQVRAMEIDDLADLFNQLVLKESGKAVAITRLIDNINSNYNKIVQEEGKEKELRGREIPYVSEEEELPIEEKKRKERDAGLDKAADNYFFNLTMDLRDVKPEEWKDKISFYENDLAPELIDKLMKPKNKVEREAALTSLLQFSSEYNSLMARDTSSWSKKEKADRQEVIEKILLQLDNIKDFLEKELTKLNEKMAASKKKDTALSDRLFERTIMWKVAHLNIQRFSEKVLELEKDRLDVLIFPESELLSDKMIKATERKITDELLRSQYIRGVESYRSIKEKIGQEYEKMEKDFKELKECYKDQRGLEYLQYGPADSVSDKMKAEIKGLNNKIEWYKKSIRERMQIMKELNVSKRKIEPYIKGKVEKFMSK